MKPARKNRQRHWQQKNKKGKRSFTDMARLLHKTYKYLTQPFYFSRLLLLTRLHSIFPLSCPDTHSNGSKRLFLFFSFVFLPRDGEKLPLLDGTTPQSVSAGVKHKKML
jgi:hypothetical protein